MAKKKLSVIYTGGTIAMTKGRDGILRPPEDPKDFANAVPIIYKSYDIYFVPILNKDSTDMMPEDWEEITNTIMKEIETNDPAGIIVVHGVDTICFTASAVSYALGPNLSCPVVFTGAQLPADKIYGDGQINLIRSAEVAATSKVNEVMVLFNTKVFRACRAQKDDDKDFDAVKSPAFPPLIVVKDPLEISNLIKPEKYKDKDKLMSMCMNNFSSGILPIPLSPGNIIEMQMAALKSEKCNGVILFSFGGHTVPRGKNDYIQFIKKAREEEKPLLIASHYPTITTEYDLYESGIDASNAEAIPVSGYVLPALVSKFSWILAHTTHIRDYKNRREIITKVMQSPYVGEIRDKKNEDFSSEDLLKTLNELLPKTKK